MLILKQQDCIFCKMIKFKQDIKVFKENIINYVVVTGKKNNLKKNLT